jgi:hypothetical protein
MFDLRKLFVRDADRRRDDQGRDTEVNPSSAGTTGQGLEAEYEGLISTQFRRWGITDTAVTVDVRPLGKAHDGLDVYVGMVRLAHWERTPALRLLLGLPMLETKIRKTVRSLWIGEVSHFGGLWLHASEQLHTSAAPGELRELMMQLTPPGAVAPGAGGGEVGEDTFSVPGAANPHSTQAAPSTATPSLGPASAATGDESVTG